MDEKQTQPAGKFIRFRIPEDLHTKLRVDSITQKPKKNLDVLCTEYIVLGYETAHNGKSDSKIKSNK